MMKRIGAVCEDWLMASSARVDFRKKSSGQDQGVQDARMDTPTTLNATPIRSRPSSAGQGTNSSRQRTSSTREGSSTAEQSRSRQRNSAGNRMGAAKNSVSTGLQTTPRNNEKAPRLSASEGINSARHKNSTATDRPISVEQGFALQRLSEGNHARTTSSNDFPRLDILDRNGEKAAAFPPSSIAKHCDQGNITLEKVSSAARSRSSGRPATSIHSKGKGAPLGNLERKTEYAKTLSEQNMARSTAALSDEVICEPAFSLDELSMGSGASHLDMSSITGTRQRSRSTSFPDRHAWKTQAPSFLTPNVETEEIEPVEVSHLRSHRRRVQSERSGKQTGIHLTKPSTGSKSRNNPRTGSFRTEAAPRLTGLFTNKSRLVTWPMGVAPRVLYAVETNNELDDGRGTAGLCATLLCKMGAGHRTWDVVRANEPFRLRVVGWHGGNLTSTGNVDIDGRAVVYTTVDVSEAGNSGKTVVHDECCMSNVAGYHCVTDRRGTAVIRNGCNSDYVRVTVGLWIGHSDEGRVTDMSAEVKWRLLSSGEANKNSARRVPPGSMLLRFGYYFFLDEPCSTRLFTNTDTPEHIRLVARRLSDGVIDEDVSKALSYVVVRVSAD